ncbi:MAG TPA: putative peptidoglycan glycosyltransferase FtsW [Gemmatimonadales bacterium]|nr:putative peptidoglycan glycosyltransferase FtsW [Gemmatimonadales bacterium]
MSLRPVRHPGELRWETRLLGMVTVVLVVFGIAATYGAASLVTLDGQNLGIGFALRQLSGAFVGGLLLLLASRLDYYRWRQLAWPLLFLTIGFLLVPLLPFTRAIAPLVNGARRWVDIGPFNFQPSELARVVVVIWCAMLASKKGEQVREFKKGVLPFILILGVISVLILLEPNLSMATVVALLGGLVLFTSGAKIGHFALFAGMAMILVFHQIRDVQYRLARLLTFLNPGDATTEAGFQIHQSLVGIGSGQIFGVGFGEGQQKLGYLPYAYSDFLFSTIGEEWGFIGVLLVVSLFTLFCWLGFRIARTATDPFGQYLAVGLTAAIGLTAFMHMAVSLGLIPTTGLTLPFMSYGRSSQVISLLATGILINVGRLRGSARAAGPRKGRTGGRAERRNDGTKEGGNEGRREGWDYRTRDRQERVTRPRKSRG